MKQENLISLVFVVNGVENTIEKVNVNQPLSVSVNKALKDSGNTGRDISDWQLKWNDNNLDINNKVEDYNLPNGAQLFLSLKAGIGGNEQ